MARPCAEQLVVHGRQRLEEQLPARCELADRVALERRRDGLVDRVPVLDPVAECVGHESGVVGEPVGGLTIEPAAALLDARREVPVVERGERCDAGGEQLIDHAVVVPDPLGMAGTCARGLHAHPRDREAVPVDAEALQQLDVLAIAVEAVRTGFGGRSVAHAASAVDEVVPDGAAAASLGASALDLECGGGRRPAKAAQRRGEGTIVHDRAPSLSCEAPRDGASDLPSSGGRRRPRRANWGWRRTW